MFRPVLLPVRMHQECALFLRSMHSPCGAIAALHSAAAGRWTALGRDLAAHPRSIHPCTPVHCLTTRPPRLRARASSAGQLGCFYGSKRILLVGASHVARGSR